MAATQLRHAKLWFAGKMKNWDLAAYEIDEIKEGLEDVEKQFPTHDGVPIADMTKTIIRSAKCCLFGSEVFSRSPTKLRTARSRSCRP
jgi:hypothetical protein